ncbi:hypothetical protein H6P81_006017 [Aristolochia fimbriata]|uniref:Ferrochelatase n=1 Tax=Aristolochia fimbriata TaxID=158543 RepID=A0AAV7EWC3_ARIFI|nr:hypothetical protein H6P81_006017 [Aristolochia fimbriata]
MDIVPNSGERTKRILNQCIKNGFEEIGGRDSNPKSSVAINGLMLDDGTRRERDSYPFDARGATTTMAATMPTQQHITEVKTREVVQDMVNGHTDGLTDDFPLMRRLKAFGIRYGKYCGVGWTDCPGEKPCDDDLDACCKTHDECVEKKRPPLSTGHSRHMQVFENPLTHKLVGLKPTSNCHEKRPTFGPSLLALARDHGNYVLLQVKVCQFDTNEMAVASNGVPKLKLCGVRVKASDHNPPAQFIQSKAFSSNEASFRTSKKPLEHLQLVDKRRILGSPCVHKENLVGQTLCSTGYTFDLYTAEAHSRAAEDKVGVLLLNLGAPKSKEGYAAIGGGSPLWRITDEQAHALKLALEAKKIYANVYVGMRYWHPFTEEAVNQIKRDGITKLVVLPLYPQFSISTSGSSIRVLQGIFREDPYLATVPVSIIESWYQRVGYIKSMADLIENELQSFSKPEEVIIFFSAHGVPVSYVEDAGDPYRDKMEECISLIMKELRSRGLENNHTLAYQSRVGPVQWLKPYTDEVLVELGKKGVKNLLAVPISFVKNWGRVPALGCTSSFITDLADAVIEALPSAKAMGTAKDSSSETDRDLTKKAMSLIFGSVPAFALLLFPRVVMMFRNYVL